MPVYLNQEEMITDRLILKMPVLDDADDLYEYASDTEATKYLSWFDHLNIGDTVKFVKWMQKDNQEGKNMNWVIVDKELNKSIGSISIFSNGDASEVWFWIGKEFWGRGYMTEALGKVKDYAKRNGFTRIIGKHIKENIGSGKVFANNNFRFFKSDRSLNKTGIVDINIHEFVFDKT